MFDYIKPFYSLSYSIMKKIIALVMLVAFSLSVASAAVSPLYMFKLNQFRAGQCLNYTGNVQAVTVTYTDCGCFVGGNAGWPTLFESHPSVTVTNPNAC